MNFTLQSAVICMLALTVLLNVSPCTCNKNSCSPARGVTNGIRFKLKDKVTGNDILSFSGSVLPVPDSIKLKDLRTGIFYSLFMSKEVNEVIVYSQEYQKPANMIDSAAFYFGNAIPDTLLIYIGLVDGWRGDECPTIKDPGITRVVLRNQVLVETTNDDAVFALRK